MTEDEFIEALEFYYGGRSPYEKSLEHWKEWICAEENKVLFNFVICAPDYRPTIEEVRKLWRIENSPLAKALK